MADETITTEQEPTAETPAPEPTPRTDEPLGDGGLKALQAEREARKAAEKAAKDAADRLADLERQQLSEQERAVADARAEGERAAAEAYARRLAEAELARSLTGRVSDVDALVESLDVSRFVKDGDVDRDAISATAEKLAKVAPAQPPNGFPPVNLGTHNPGPGQVTADEVKTMTPDEIAEAFAAGRFKTLGLG